MTPSNVLARFRHGRFEPLEPPSADLRNGSLVELAVGPLQEPEEPPPSFIRFLAAFVAVVAIGICALVGLFMAVFYGLEALTGIASTFMTMEALLGLGALAGFAAILWSDLKKDYRRRVRGASPEKRDEP